ncbi:hypothetical protein JDV02_000911 [Purpureocillium takamizusanense]|uniref:Uncharacterized protein n=1 Tax=Purpureocillium takamizusanense TaxID=2060973 RepID=A0A9Q8Q882_9HYPO|nr:uncharacterized protein JDV02_000911 [Purpureocillium takamizusanense]UNI14266.1 hypothetical protein JDV02_000911 [Purpureocillium takamizusanense]
MPQAFSGLAKRASLFRVHAQFHDANVFYVLARVFDWFELFEVPLDGSPVDHGGDGAWHAPAMLINFQATRAWLLSDSWSRFQVKMEMYQHWWKIKRTAGFWISGYGKESWMGTKAHCPRRTRRRDIMG